jgi:hypothetical protein
LVPRLVGGSMLLDRLADVIDQRLHVMLVAQKRCPARIRYGLCNVTRQSALRRLDYGMRDFDLIVLDGNQLTFGMGSAA